MQKYYSDMLIWFGEEDIFFFIYSEKKSVFKKERTFGFDSNSGKILFFWLKNSGLSVI